MMLKKHKNGKQISDRYHQQIHHLVKVRLNNQLDDQMKHKIIHRLMNKLKCYDFYSKVFLKSDDTICRTKKT